MRDDLLYEISNGDQILSIPSDNSVHGYRISEIVGRHEGDAGGADLISISTSAYGGDVSDCRVTFIGSNVGSGLTVEAPNGSKIKNNHFENTSGVNATGTETNTIVKDNTS
ncbi:hypothetical protein [Halostagnicola kamekurae]|uniref:Right handed beta helix region n=1 Tax=Halostagnicola kamekurae TaxID=619731 RepID=A0A1I6QNX4_9EURY|nr:hypothetical protein [Halostagnicola kamekurae]SFS54100.1 hypothetical protein SAMN04488556_1408 [Halostagnicola kamekurae]